MNMFHQYFWVGFRIRRIWALCPYSERAWGGVSETSYKAGESSLTSRGEMIVLGTSSH